MSASVNIKIAPIEVTNYPHGMVTDKSAPGSLITDADEGGACTVYAAGECRPTSTVGQVFVALRRWADPYAHCMSNEATLGAPCAFGLSPHGGWMVQVRNKPMDTTNTGVRRLSLGWTMPLSHYTFSNWISTPDAKWGLYVGNPIQQRPIRGVYSGSHWFAIKLPKTPVPLSDGINRTKFVNVPITLNGITGDNVRVAIGYGENGNPASHYCLTRQEACWTKNSATLTNPFLFAGEAQDLTPCGTGCVVNVPVIPGRIAFIQIERTNGASTLLSPLQAIDETGAVFVGGMSRPGKTSISGKSR